MIGWLADRWRTGPGWRGAGIALAAVALALWLARSVAQVIPGAAAASWRMMAVDVVVAVALGLVTGLILTVIARLISRPLPAPFVAVLVTSLVLVLTLSPGASLVAWLVIALVLLAAAGLIGGWIGSMIGARGGRARRAGRTRTVITAVAAVSALALVAWLAWPGSSATGESVERSPDLGQEFSEPGPLAVEEFTYGSGHDSPARYGAEADVQSRTADASELLPEWDAASPRTAIWGYDAAALPLNATVWSPQEAGPHPLVVMVHGNTPHADSELGFDYLGEQLASHGFVVASIDQSFINTGLLDRSGGLAQGDRVRAWLVGAHLQQWRDWGEEPPTGIPDVDLDRISLLGHSRGGEAVAVTAAIQAGTAEPDWSPGPVEGVEVAAVVALAPTDGYLTEESEATELSGVDYLTVAGTHDADTTTFAGTRQYHRVDPGGDGLKIAVLMHRGNHSQFNSRWGRVDIGQGLAGRVIDTAVLLAPEQQRQATQALVTTFLQASVEDSDEARQTLGAPLTDASWWPPGEVRIARAAGEEGSRAGFDETPEGAVPEGGVESGAGTVTVTGTDAEVGPLPARGLPTDNPVLTLAPGDDPVSVTLEVDGLPEGADLAVDLADAAPSGQNSERLAASLTVIDGQDGETTCALSDGVAPTLDGHYGKRWAPMPLPSSEPFLATAVAPASCWSDGQADPEDITALRLDLDSVGAGGVHLDDLGYSQ